MNLRRFLVPSSETGFIKKQTAKKIISVVLTSLAILSAVLDTAGDLPSTSTAEAQAGGVSVPAGLTRSRGAFRKAISILTDGAGANQHLASYLDGLTKRVKGDAVSAESSSGVATLKHGSGIRATVARTGNARTAASARAESAAAQPASSSNVVASSTDSEKQFTVNSHLTVGDMAFETNPAIEHWMSYYTSSPIGKRTMKVGIERCDAYLEMARAEFRNAGVPEDLVWLAFVESVWNPRAVSPAAAGGIWQFIPATATDYGLRVKSGDDERADPFKQTRVAAVYLHDLYTIFGDWALVMAAYNSGEPRVMGAIVKNGRANFWDLYEKELLPKETRDYVPKILAAIKVASQQDSEGHTSRSALETYSGS
ncbi:MAG TPA: lytic transglycosylase domain-containing protein [Blastocatellia bacterium]|nr:lytic transglycosylase domain-containing protein [Blastocatellia bacterium]